MALDEHCKSALIATRVRCADILAPLAGRLIYDLRTHRDLEGGPILSAELAGELDGVPNGRDKIMRLWEEMTRKGVRGWRVLMLILERVNPNTRMFLEDTAEQIRAKDDYGSPLPGEKAGVHVGPRCDIGELEELTRLGCVCVCSLCRLCGCLLSRVPAVCACLRVTLDVCIRTYI